MTNCTFLSAGGIPGKKTPRHATREPLCITRFSPVRHASRALRRRRACRTVAGSRY
ncbi:MULTISPECIES: hypothetical protein [Desulfococcus]|uniref:hypothetical protein n=1 Tax=Desulfococcus TaxID=896 RepID=UPI0012946617|nr:hypothetical protein [Desulfococcus multivorans]MDX9819982.1 hypothetical protein [Desulfococcus multivorans]